MTPIITILYGIINMMKLSNVKSTMLERLLDAIIPHYCCSCGEIGKILCESCKYDIISEPFVGCLLCGSITPSRGCKACKSSINDSWCGGERTGALESLINAYKFEYASVAHKPLGDIMLAAIPDIPKNTIVVPIPTVRKHIRERGYDHTVMLARYIADKRGLQFQQPLARKHQNVQRGKNKSERLRQAEEAFIVTEHIDSSAPYLLIDDVVTTGATIRYAAKALKDSGASIVWAAAVARQPLD